MPCFLTLVDFGFSTSYKLYIGLVLFGVLVKATDIHLYAMAAVRGHPGTADISF